MIRWILITLSVSSLFSYNLHAASTTDDEAVLKKLNIEIAAAEDRGDRKWLEDILAQEFAFRRANAKVVGREQFLKDVKSRAPSKTNIESVKLYGDRAVVTCIVTIKIDDQDADFHNVRLFVREGTGWKLLGWANERLIKK